MGNAMGRMVSLGLNRAANNHMDVFIFVQTWSGRWGDHAEKAIQNLLNQQGVRREQGLLSIIEKILTSFIKRRTSATVGWGSD